MYIGNMEELAVKNGMVQIYNCDRCGKEMEVPMTWPAQTQFVEDHYIRIRGRSLCLCDECLKDFAKWLLAKKES